MTSSGTLQLNAPHVPDAALGPLLTACPICGDQHPRSVVVTLQNDPKVELLQCTHCGGRSASHMPTAAYLNELYDPTKYHSDLLGSAQATERCASRIASFLDGFKTKPLRLLDYGGSDGTLSHALDQLLTRRGFTGKRDFTVVDLHSRPPAPPLRFIDLNAFSKLEERFDVVLASAVIEHLPNLREVVQRLLELRAPESVFYARTPCDAPLQRWFPGYRVRWPRHLHDLGPEFWAQFTNTFHCPGKLVHSSPSVIESDYRRHPIRSSIAFMLKLPGHMETRFLQPMLQYSVPKWDLVGGWEVVIRTP